MKSILGYSDKISARPGERIAFMVSSLEEQAYEASIVRIVHGDSNPARPGCRFEPVATEIDGQYPGRRQEALAGSYALVPDHPLFAALESFTLQAMIWPTLPGQGAQSLIARWDEGRKAGFILGLDRDGCVALTLGDGSGKVATVGSGRPVVAREWYLAAASFDAATGEVVIHQVPQTAYARTDDAARVTARAAVAPADAAQPLLFAAHRVGTVGDRLRTAGHYNGKIDSPAVSRGVLDALGLERVLTGRLPAAAQPALVARWDFGQGIGGETVTDISPNGLHGETVNLPVRAMKGHNWTGREMNWQRAPDEYGAIHFHDDDLYDCGWETDFTLTVPAGLTSGLYAARVRIAEGQEDFMPFVVRAPRGKAGAKAVFLVPTASYMAYANEHMAIDGAKAEVLAGRLPILSPNDVFLAENRNFGGSCYDTHSDGSGICYSSRLRPILNMRPDYQSWVGGIGSALWQFNADTHITDWLEAQGFAFDCITDEDLHHDGLAALDGYDVVMTGTHPEYHSTAMWDAMDAFKKRGGRLMYLGANGWYWRIAYHPSKPGVMEVRRNEDGIRAWAAEPGEYYHAFTGEYGGLWRRQGRPPQIMAGTGFSAQGFDISSHYRRQPGADDPRAAFVFDGVPDQIIGDFGLIGGGAAGLELDRADRLLGTPPNALVLASSENHTDIYLVVCEEILINYPGQGGQEDPLVRADMVFFETPAGGAVFSTSSIAWAGSLSHNGYDNNVSRITGNVLRRFLDPTPF
ncbi:MAG: LamG-like jellyroll fold domain-containing protein [Sneathiellaceae bacterium]